MPIVVVEFPLYAPETFSLYTLGVRYCHASARQWLKLSADGVIAIEQTYDCSGNTFGPMDDRKKAPPLMALEPRMLELVRAHRRHLMDTGHVGLKAGLLFPSATGTRPIGNDQLNDIWREAQVKAGLAEPTTIHALRHTFHDVARYKVSKMLGRSTGEQ